MDGLAPWQGMLLFAAALALLLVLLRRAGLAVYRRTAAAEPARPGEGGPEAPGHDEELLAVLAAAALAAAGRQVRLRRIRFLQPEGSAWAVTGRLNIMASHLVRKGNR